MIFKRIIPLLIVVSIGCLTLFGHFIDIEFIQNFVNNDSTQWFDIIASFAIFLGSLNLIKLQSLNIIKKKKNWPYSLLAVLSLLLDAVFPPPEDRNGELANRRKWSRWGAYDFHQPKTS